MYIYVYYMYVPYDFVQYTCSCLVFWVGTLNFHFTAPGMVGGQHFPIGGSLSMEAS